MSESRSTKNGSRWFWRVGFLAALLTIVAFAAAGCGGGKKTDTGVATAPASASSGASPAASGGGDPVAYAQCMRRNGIPNFPDPAKDGSIKFGSKDNIDPNSAEFKAADAKCKQYRPAGEPNMTPGQDPWSPELKLQYAKCMRANGEPSFPDPDKDGFFPNLSRGGPVDPDSAQFKKADAACAQYKPHNMPTSGPQGGQAP